LKAPRAIGIDFGTSNSAASILQADGSARLFALDGQESHPELLKSLLYFPSRRESFFGGQAIREYFERDREGRFFQSIKRLLPSPSFKGTVIHHQFVSLEELISRFLSETRRRIESEIGPIPETLPVMMGRPARYSLEQERELLAATRFKKACELAGFTKVTFIEEPKAAALTYRPRTHKPELVLVADLGGGTSDFTLMRVQKGKPTEVLSSYGVPVAGDALDSAFVAARLTSYFGSEIRYQRPFSENVLTMPTSFMSLLPKWHQHAFLKEKDTWNFIQNLRKEIVDRKQLAYLENLITLVEDNLGYALHQRVEQLKVDLSLGNRADFVFKSYPIDIQLAVTRSEYDQIISEPAEAIRNAAVETAALGKVDPQEVHFVYFTGGTSKVPLIRELILRSFPQAETVDQDAFTSVAAGLALSAGA
jgi:hypothetical chaperone protein